MNLPLGDCLLNHYERYMKAPIDRRVFESERFGRSIQILAYDGVFEGCRVFASLGPGHFTQELGGAFEVVCAIDDGWEQVPAILANTLFRVVELRLTMTAAGRIAGI